MGSPNHRGEISRMVDDFFINYTLGLPDKDSASTSGYYTRTFVDETGAPGLHKSYFTVQRGAASSIAQDTEVYEIDHEHGNKKQKLATVTWSSIEGRNACLALITGYKLPQEWEQQLELPYYTYYISTASLNQPGIGNISAANADHIDMGHDQPMGEIETGQPEVSAVQLHIQRPPNIPSAILTIELTPVAENASLELFFYQRIESSNGSHMYEVTNPPNIDRSDSTKIKIGESNQPLQVGLYVLAKPRPSAQAGTYTVTSA